MDKQNTKRDWRTHRHPDRNPFRGAPSPCCRALQPVTSLARRFSRRCLFGAVSLTALAISSAFAADTPEAMVAYRPGDTVRIFITFKEPISLKGADVRFNLEGTLPEGQKVFLNYFDVTSPVKSSEKEFELTGKIGDDVASGTYQLAFINATDQADLTRMFNPGPDFPAITVCVRNDNHISFPDIKSVRIGGEEHGKE